MAAYCLPLLGFAAVLTGILFLIGVGCGKLFVFRLCCKTNSSEEDKQSEIPCAMKCCSFSMIIFNMVINLLTFIFCVWLFYSLNNGHDYGYDDLYSHKWGILAVIFRSLWLITKAFYMYIFLARLVGLFNATPYAFKKCVPNTLMCIMIVACLTKFIPMIMEYFIDTSMALKAVRLVRILFPLSYIIVMATIVCLYGQRYRVIVKRRLSMPSIQNDDGLDTQRIVRYALMTNFVLRAAILVWIIEVMRGIFMINNGNTEAAVALAICLDAMIGTMAILFLFDFSDSLYFRFCMCNRDGYATKCSPHNICNCFIRCCCCVPKTETRGIQIGDTYTDTYTDI